MSKLARALASPASLSNALLALSLLDMVALFTGTSRGIVLGLCTLSGALAASGLSLFARSKRAAARRALVSNVGGRITELSAGGRRVFELPGAGIEPWANDAWVVVVVTLAVLWLGGTQDALGRPAAFVLGGLTLALGLRLGAAGADHIRLELGPGGLWVEASEGGRLIRRSGFGALRPELLVDALVLWSAAGRIGVLRAELEPEERAFLAARLAAVSEAAQASSDMNQGEASEERQSEQREADQ
jgi:hypothetical protein